MLPQPLESWRYREGNLKGGMDKKGEIAQKESRKRLQK